MNNTKKIEYGLETIANAKSHRSLINDHKIIDHFANAGIPAETIEPRVNVFTYNAWLALGRQVKRGSKGCKITTFKNMTKLDRATGQRTSFKAAAGATVFHISQTEPSASQQIDLALAGNIGGLAHE